MNVSFGRPVIALASAACIAMPGVADANAATGPTLPTASTISTASSFDPLPQAAASVDAATLLALLTFPYHNVYGVTVAVGNAAAAGLQVALLPLSIASLVGANQTDQVPAYVKSTMAAAAAAIPGIVKAVQAEIQYDLNLFSQLGGGGSMLRADSVTAASPGGATLLALLTFPYHNVLGVTVGFTNAAAAALRVVLLPVSVASLVGANQTDQVPAYVKSTLANAAAAIPGIFKAIQAEIDYDRNLFSQLGSGLASATATATPKADSRLVNVSVAATAKVEADTQSTEPKETQKTSDQRGTDVDASATTPGENGSAAAETAGTTEKRDDETASENKVSTTESVKKTPKKGTDDASDTVGDTPKGDSGPHTTTSSTGDADSTASKGATASDAAPTGKSGADSTPSAK